MNLISTFLKRPTAVAMFVLAILITGLASIGQLPLELTPDVSFQRLSVNTSWYDASPEIVEAFVTSPIEAVANTVSKVRKVDSISEEGNSAVNIEFNRGTNMDFATLELSEKLSMIHEDLPYGVRQPRIQAYIPREFQSGVFLSYHLTGDFSLHDVRRYALEHLKRPLLGIEGVVDVFVRGGQDPELQIEVDPNKLQAFGLNIYSVSAALNDVNIRMAAGRTYHGKQRFDIIIEDPQFDPQKFENLIISSKNGSTVRVNDVATVVVGFNEPQSYTRINGNPAVVIDLQNEIGTNTIKISDQVFAKLAELEKEFPPTLRLIKERDQSENIRNELTNLTSRAVFCILVIFTVLVIFLRNLISPIIILSTIFFSVLLTLNLFYLTEISLNLLTLAGLALGFGMLVDTSIVVFDNIFRYKETGLSPFESALLGTKEVSLPIIASTMTTISVFIPFLYMTGELRIYYLPFAMAVGLSLFSSLIVAFSFTPSLALQVMKHRKDSLNISGQNTEKNILLKKLIEYYQQFLAFFMRHKILTILLTIFFFFWSYHLFDKYVTKGRIWEWGEDTYIRVTIRMPVGTESSRTNEITQFFENKVVGDPNIQKVYSRVSPEYANIEIRFPKEVQYSAFPLILKEELINHAASIAGPNVSVAGFGPGFYRGGGSAPSFRLQVLGYNYNEVKRIAERLGKSFEKNARVRDVNTNTSSYYFRDNLYEMTLQVNRKQLMQYDLSPAQVLNSVQTYFKENFGRQKIRMGASELEYRIKIKGYKDFNLNELKQLIITTPSNKKVRVNQVALIGERQVLSRIIRENQQYQRWVSFEFRGPYKLGDRFVDGIVKTTTLPPGYKIQRRNFYFLGEEEKKQIYWVLAFSLLLVYMVTAGLFESLIYPFVVILTVPLALIGVFLIFYFTDSNFDRSAYIGVILLGGIVVNNAIILIDHINLLRRKGMLLLDAVIQGTQNRFRPILMTSSTSILGLLPLVLFSKASEGIWHALALSTIGGLLSSTLLVLVVIPVVYVIFTRK